MGPAAVKKLLDFQDCKTETYPGERDLSREDRKFLRVAEAGKKFHDGHYTFSLPFPDEDVMMPDNKMAVLKRALHQKKKMLRDSKYYSDYVDFMNKILECGYAAKVPEGGLHVNTGKVWYLPHHGIYHPHKPEKIRVIFECSAKFSGTSINEKLIQGQDMTNTLIGVLSHFRTEYVAFMADIQSMFLQVHIRLDQRNFLRFWWWSDGDLTRASEEYQMNVHLFGAVSSPSIPNLALIMAGNTSGNPAVTETIHGNFNVDDCLKSVESTPQAVALIDNLRQTCSNNGFRLTKYMSNNYDVISSIPPTEQSKEMAARDIHHDGLAIEPALGIQWDIEHDVFQFTITSKEKPTT